LRRLAALLARYRSLRTCASLAPCHPPQLASRANHSSISKVSQASARREAFTPPKSVAAIGRSPASAKDITTGSGSAHTRITISSGCDQRPPQRTPYSIRVIGVIRGRLFPLIRVHLSRGSLGEGGFACLAVLSRRSFREDGSLARRWVSLRGYPKQKPRRTLPAGL